MTKFICPNCRGGFPEGPLDNGCCPWCEQPLDGSYDPPESPIVSRVESSDEAEHTAGGGPIYRKLFGWLE